MQITSETKPVNAAGSWQTDGMYLVMDCAAPAAFYGGPEADLSRSCITRVILAAPALSAASIASRPKAPDPKITTSCVQQQSIVMSAMQHAVAAASALCKLCSRRQTLVADQRFHDFQRMCGQTALKEHSISFWYQGEEQGGVHLALDSCRG